MYNLEAFMNGDIAEMMEALAVAEQTEKLKESNLA
jgi:protein subunit release factor A